MKQDYHYDVFDINSKTTFIISDIEKWFQLFHFAKLLYRISTNRMRKILIKKEILKLETSMSGCRCLLTGKC